MLGYHGRVVKPHNLLVLRTIWMTQTQAERTMVPTLAIESAPLVHVETTTSSVAPSEGPANVRTPPLSRRNSTTHVSSCAVHQH